MAVQKAFTDRGIIFQRLGPGSATYENVKKYVQNNPITYLYINAHGNFLVEEGIDFPILRTSVTLSDGPVFSVKKSDFPLGGAPSWCEGLGGFWEDPNAPNRGKTFWSMGFTNVKLAYFDCCFSGILKINVNNQLIIGQPGPIGLFDLPQSDMSFALGMDEPLFSHLYQGWYNDPNLNPRDKPETDAQKWTRNEWERLGEGDNILDAIMYTIGQQTNLEAPYAPVNNYRLKGRGSYFDIILGGD